MLTELVVDGRQNWSVRSSALLAISELPLEDDNAFDIELLAKLSAWLLNEAVREFEAKPNRSYWRPTMLKIYFSFRPRTAEMAELMDLVGSPNQTWPKFRGASTTVTAALNVVMPIVAQVFPAPPNALPRLSNESVAALKAFVDENTPEGSVHPRANPLDFSNARPNGPPEEPAPGWHRERHCRVDGRKQALIRRSAS